MNLADLVTSHAAGRTWTGLAEATGGLIPAYRWQQMASLPITDTEWRPYPRQVEVIAAALGVPDADVLAAIDESREAARA